MQNLINSWVNNQDRLHAGYEKILAIALLVESYHSAVKNKLLMSL